MAAQETFELLSPQNDWRYPAGSSTTSTNATSKDHLAAPAGHEASERRDLRPSLAIHKLLPYVPLGVSLAPLALIIGFAGKLSHTLAKTACTPGGEFVVPLTSNIWDARAFFEITMPFVGRASDSCSYSGSDPFENRDCIGYSFTGVKVIDLAWDVLVGRGGQALLVVFAYMLFSRVIVALMERGNVSYEVFATVAFQTGTCAAVWRMFWQVVRSTPVPRTRRAYWCYLLMLLTTSYIVAYPSLVSAMSGYTTRFRPFIRRGDPHRNTGVLVDCHETFLPVWGRLGMSYLEVEIGMITWASPMTGTNVSALTFENEDMWIAYYYQHKEVYDSCPDSLDIYSCPAAQRNTTLIWHYDGQEGKTGVYSPMPGIIPYSDDRTYPSGKTKYRHWICGPDLLINTRGLIQSSDYDITDTTFEGENYVGVCQADETYAWGFSFLLTFMVAALHLLFVLMMYTLWLVNRKTWNASDRAPAPGIFPDAVTMVTQAQKQSSVNLDEWTPAKLRKDIFYGKTSMSFKVDKSVRRRNVFKSEEST